MSMPVNFKPEIDIKDAVVVVHLEGHDDLAVRGRFIKQQDGFIHLYGHQVSEPGNLPDSSQKSPIEAESLSLRSYMNRSALVRFMVGGRFATGAVTHVTDKAWRVLNLDLGAAWMPKNVLRWSSVAQQFCVIDEDYTPVFTKNIEEEMSEFPTTFDATDLVEELYR